MRAPWWHGWGRRLVQCQGRAGVLAHATNIQQTRAHPADHACSVPALPADELAALRAQIESDQRLLIQFAEEKVQLAVQGYDLLEQHLAQADLDIVHLEAVVSFFCHFVPLRCCPFGSLWQLAPRAFRLCTCAEGHEEVDVVSVYPCSPCVARCLISSQCGFPPIMCAAARDGHGHGRAVHGRARLQVGELGQGVHATCIMVGAWHGMAWHGLAWHARHKGFQ